MKNFLLIVAMVQASPSVSGVTTHVIDTSVGLPGAQMKIEIFKQPNKGVIDETKRELMKTV